MYLKNLSDCMRIPLDDLKRRTSKVSHSHSVKDIVRAYGPKVVHVRIQDILEIRISRIHICHH